MDIKIGVTYSPREVAVEVDDGTDPAALKAEVEKVLGQESAIWWITDNKGRQVGVPGDKIAYVEIGSAEDGGPIGFGG